MIHVRKGAPPPALTTFRKTPDASTDPPRAARYDGPGFNEVKPTVRAALVAEQRGLCCYCNDRLGEGDDAVKIEHRVPQHGAHADASRDLDWTNLFAACKGSKPDPKGRGADRLHCDSAKGDRALSIDPSVETHMAKIAYDGRGRIKSTNPDFDRELNEVLNLNLDALVEQRARALTELQVQLHRKHGVNDLPVEKLHKLLEVTRDPPGRALRPFAGFLCAWIVRAIRKSART